MIATAVTDQREDLYLNRPVDRGPVFKALRITGEPVRVNGKVLAPALGVPYGCKFWSPVVLYTTGEDTCWRPLEIVALAEDTGSIYTDCKLTVDSGRVYVVMKDLVNGYSWSKLDLKR